MTEPIEITVGQKMVITSSLSSRIAKVTKVCKHYFVCDGYKWRRDQWMSLMNAGRFNTTSIEPLTPEFEQKLMADKRRYIVRNFEYSKLDQATIDQIYDLIKGKDET